MIKPISSLPALKFDRSQVVQAEEVRGEEEREKSSYRVLEAEPVEDVRPIFERRKSLRPSAQFLAHLMASSEKASQLRAQSTTNLDGGPESYVSRSAVERASETGALLATSA